MSAKKSIDYTAGLTGFEAFLTTEPREATTKTEPSTKEIIKGVAKATGKKERLTRRVNLLMPPSLVETMMAECAEHGLSMNAGAALAFQLFIDELRSQTNF